MARRESYVFSWKWGRAVLNSIVYYWSYTNYVQNIYWTDVTRGTGTYCPLSQSTCVNSRARRHKTWEYTQIRKYSNLIAWVPYLRIFSDLSKFSSFVAPGPSVSWARITQSFVFYLIFSGCVFLFVIVLIAMYCLSFSFS